ncbi:MAG: hypothetical protein LBQ54_01590 [Planctomycetaceae bacterium]|nr:hypothetical protein [Planctomycetaceae bacterium]
MVKMAVLRPTPQNPLSPHFPSDPGGSPLLSERSRLTLRTYDLERLAETDRLEAAVAIHRKIQQSMTPDLLYTFAEITCFEGIRSQETQPQLAAELFTAAAFYSYIYLFDPQFAGNRNYYDPQFRNICLLYNGALESLLRLVGTDRNSLTLTPDQDYQLKTGKNDWNLRVELKSDQWKDGSIETFKFASDYKIVGLENRYRQYGIGVPLLAFWKFDSMQSPVGEYYPDQLTVPATVILRPYVREITEGDPNVIHAALEFYNPLETDHLKIAENDVPLETDLTTPIAYSVSNPMYMVSGSLGVFDPGKLLQKLPGRNRSAVGFYMLQPYEPNKIPVVMVHGLFSSPLTWMEMFNSLRSVPEIRKNYQFWFYFYPSGQPFWLSAAALRQDLEDLRQTVDPERLDLNLDQMVLVGHSMGGLISMLQTVDSDDRFWKLLSDKPFQELQSDPKIAEEIQNVLFFKPNPSVKQVITIATPFRGSHYANSATRLLGKYLIKLPANQIKSFLKDLGSDQRDAFARGRIFGEETSVDSLTPDSPFLTMLGKSPRAPWIEYHNIVGKREKSPLQYFGIPAAPSDGVIRMESSQVDWAESETVVPAMHMKIHTHPKAIMEVRRILLGNLESAEVQQAIAPRLIPEVKLGLPSEKIPPRLLRQR